MIADALAGKIDLIVTKSVSRFARNTVDSLTAIRKLKDYGVEVYFQKENISATSPPGGRGLPFGDRLVQLYRQQVNPKVNVYCIQTAGHTNVLVPEYGYRTAVLYGWTGRELVFADAMWRILIFLCIYIFMLVLCAKWNTIILDISNQFAY